MPWTVKKFTFIHRVCISIDQFSFFPRTQKLNLMPHATHSTAWIQRKILFSTHKASTNEQHFYEIYVLLCKPFLSTLELTLMWQARCDAFAVRKELKTSFFFVNKQWLIIVFNIIISSSRGNEEIFRAKKSKKIYKDERLLRGDVAVISARIFLNLFNYFSKINEIISMFKSIVN